MSYFKRESAERTYKSDKNLENYFKNLRDIEKNDLMSWYNQVRMNNLLLNIVKNRAKSIINLVKNNDRAFFLQEVSKIFNKIRKYSANSKRSFNCLDEEQEVELEKELEEERQIDRPEKAESLVPQVKKEVEDFVKKGIFTTSSPSFLSLINSLKNTSIYTNTLKNTSPWLSGKLFATHDFKYAVVQTETNKSDYFLRPCRWICFSEKLNIAVILSGYETNTLMPYFSSSQVSLTRILPRLRQNQKRQVNFNQIEIPVTLIEPLALYAGNFFLSSESELNILIDFLGYSLKPRSNEENKFFADGCINKNGYVPFEKRIYFKRLRSCEFKKDPYELVKKLIEIRNYGLVPDSAHHLEIFFGSKP